MYASFKRSFIADGTISLSQWPYLPTSSEIFKEEPFVSLLNADAAVDLSSVQPRDFLNAVEQQTHKITDELVKMLPNLNAKEGSPGVDRLRLATAVFSCQSVQCQGLLFFAQDDVLSHACTEQRWTFSAKASEAVRWIIGLVGLNANTCVPADLDALDLWFYCLRCPSSTTFQVSGTKERDIKGKVAYSWRECVSSMVSPNRHWI